MRAAGRMSSGEVTLTESERGSSGMEKKGAQRWRWTHWHIELWLTKRNKFASFYFHFFVATRSANGNHVRMSAFADQRLAFQTRQTKTWKKPKKKTKKTKTKQPLQLVSGFANTQRARSIPTFSIHPSRRFCGIPLNIHGGERAKRAPLVVDALMQTRCWCSLVCRDDTIPRRQNVPRHPGTQSALNG